MNILGSLRNIVGAEFVTDAEYIRESYSRGVDAVVEENRPDFVVRPESSEEISEIVKIAYNERIPIIPRGGGADLLQGIVPYNPGGIVIDTTRMDKILEINEEIMTVRAQCGITWAQLNTSLMKRGFYTGNIGPESGMSAVIGGGLSNNSYGEGSTMYGPVTKNCVGLKVVLPNKKGDIIEIGSGASKYITKPFSRHGFGPDLLGIFLGDNGIMGIKTEASLNIYKKPNYLVSHSFTVKKRPVEKTLKIFLNCRKKSNLGIYQAIFFDSSWVIAQSTKILPQLPPIYEKLNEINPRKRPIISYSIIADTEAQLEENIKIVTQITKNENGIEELDFNEFYNWVHEKNGYWQFAHMGWGALGPGSVGQSADGYVSMHQYPILLKEMSNWVKDNDLKINAAKAIPAIGTFFGLSEHTMIDAVMGLVVWNKPEFRKLNGELWDSCSEALIKNGFMPYMTGLRYSRALINAGAFSEQFYEFLKNIKQTLDPKGILSPGKYKLGMDGE